MTNMGNPIGVHSQVFAAAWEGEQRRAVAERAAAAGFGFLEVTVMDPQRFDVPGTRAALDAAGLGIACSTAMRLETDLSSADRAISARGEAHMRTMLELASELEAQWLVGVTYGAWAKYPAAPTQAGTANAVEALGRIAARADELGVSIGMEVLNRFENNLVNTTAQARAIVEQVGSPRLRVQLDSYHAHLEENSQADAVAGCGEHLGYLHVGESHRGRLGTGSVDFAQLFAAVAAQRFSGPIVYEAFSANVVGAAAAPLLCVWRDQWEDSDEVAADARRFIAAQLRTARAAAAGSAS
ncbi:sugar phosphate isomerase/epimerase [Conexibacter sp. CPCC 206217]|uniref:sugar phosphate isomerase/epimerase family protein n=1 Tax=Conexibacter sp. CPCC 206217 TaxID=3064574 RepID=UPI00271E8F81|nr:sugar phosphate isomerase/epimerase family protein [Conexibacter sp. CPCC 206217]MDO8208779.1 sugar phosphate isomerase/epimerase family protein [Conexibacter sp. CPCC 206217]